MATNKPKKFGSDDWIRTSDLVWMPLGTHGRSTWQGAGLIELLKSGTRAPPYPVAQYAIDPVSGMHSPAQG